VLLVAILLVLIVIFQNAEKTTFRVLFWSVETTRIFLAVLMVAFGFVIGFITGKLTGRK
jgi:uncharacterized integral membrane protein